MQMNGWGTAYINIPQAAGLATERLSAHVGQRIRWARGMIQILRTDNPLFAPGLKFPQRLCYFNAMCHFLYAVPRLIFLTAPLIYLLLNHTNVPGYWAAILAYALPHLMLSNVTNSRIQGEHRHSFWNEIYETVLSPYILLPTMMALINPKLGKFNVTAKGGVVKRTFFDTRIAQPFLILLIFNIAGILDRHSALLHLGSRPAGHGDHERDLVLSSTSSSWALRTAVAREMKQLRTTVRISHRDPGDGQAGRWTAGRRRDHRHVLGRNQHPLQRSAGCCRRRPRCGSCFPLPSAANELRATVVSSEGSVLRVQL